MVAEWLLPEFNTEIVDEWFSPEMRYHNRVPPARYSLRSPLGDEFRHAARSARHGGGLWHCSARLLGQMVAKLPMLNREAQ